MSLTKERQVELANPAIVETIVQQVVQRVLELQKKAFVPKDQEQGAEELKSSSNTSTVAGRVIDGLVIDEKVVTLERLRGKLDGISNVVVGAQAIVTPAVVDELKLKGITLKKVTPTKGNSGTAQEFCVARLSNHYVATEWLKEVGTPQVCCGDSYEKLAEMLSETHADSKTICFSAQPYVAVSVLNRQAKLRAAFGSNEKEIAEIKSTLDANVLVLETVQSRKEQLALVRFFMNSQKGAA